MNSFICSEYCNSCSTITIHEGMSTHSIVLNCADCGAVRPIRGAERLFNELPQPDPTLETIAELKLAIEQAMGVCSLIEPKSKSVQTAIRILKQAQENSNE